MLKKIRKQRGLSQSQLARVSGVSIRMIQHYEQGVKDIRNARAVTVIALANALGCEPEDIIKEGE